MLLPPRLNALKAEAAGAAVVAGADPGAGEAVGAGAGVSGFLPKRLEPPNRLPPAAGAAGAGAGAPSAGFAAEPKRPAEAGGAAAAVVVRAGPKTGQDVLNELASDI